MASSVTGIALLASFVFVALAFVAAIKIQKLIVAIGRKRN